MLAVLGDVQKTGNVYPTRTTFTLPDELVEGTVVENPEEPVVTGLEVWKADVRSQTKKVLGVGGTTYKTIQFWTTVAGGDNHRNIDVMAEGLENLNAEILKIRDEAFRNGIVKAVGLGGWGTGELRQAEMRGQNLIFHRT